MSKFVEKIKHVASNTSAPIGFIRPASGSNTPAILLIQDITSSLIKKGKEIMVSDLDAIIIKIDALDASAFEKLVKNHADLPVGVLLDTGIYQDLTSFMEAGCDFVLFDLDTLVNSVSQETLGKILRISKALTPGLIKAINDLNLSIDSVLIENQKSEINVDLLLSCHLFLDILNKPLIINVKKILTTIELSELHTAGVRVLLLSAEVSTKEIGELRRNINSMPKLAIKKSSGRPLIPALNNAIKTERGDDDGEDEESD